MKFIKIASFLIVIILLTTLLAGCRLVPHSETWYLSSYLKKMTFIGGLEEEVGFAQASVVYPFASADFSLIRINLLEDGSFSFTAWDGEEVNGTYTYKHEGNYTNVYFTADSGEKFEGSCIKRFSGDKYLMFDYKDASYTFSPVRREKSLKIEDIVEIVRSGNAEDLHEVTVTKQDDFYIARFSEVITYKIASDTLVYAIELNADGSYTILDKVKEGSALSTYNNKSNYIVLYYLNNEQ
jgi:hypothetical protein